MAKTLTFFHFLLNYRCWLHDVVVTGVNATRYCDRRLVIVFFPVFFVANVTQNRGKPEGLPWGVGKTKLKSVEPPL